MRAWPSERALLPSRDGSWHRGAITGGLTAFSLDSHQPLSLVCPQASPPHLASPIPRGVLLRKQAAFWGKGRLLQVLGVGCCREQAVSGLSCQALVD